MEKEAVVYFGNGQTAGSYSYFTGGRPHYSRRRLLYTERLCEPRKRNKRKPGRFVVPSLDARDMALHSPGTVCNGHSQNLWYAWLGQECRSPRNGTHFDSTQARGSRLAGRLTRVSLLADSRYLRRQKISMSTFLSQPASC